MVEKPQSEKHVLRLFIIQSEMVGIFVLAVSPPESGPQMMPEQDGGAMTNHLGLLLAGGIQVLNDPGNKPRNFQSEYFIDCNT